MTRTFKHAVTGRSLRVLEGSRQERLVEADDNWSEDNPKKSTSKKEADSGSGNAGGRRGGSRKKSDGSGD